MASKAWMLEEIEVGEGEEVANSLADKINTGIGASAKIDGAATDGLDGTYDSLAYRVAEIGRHLHGWERWFGEAVSPDGEDHVADRIGNTVTAFQLDGGNDTWGAWVQLLGPDDTPADAGMAYYDAHRLMVVAAENANSAYLIQIAAGASGADALAAGTYTEVVYHPATVQADEFPLDVLMRRRAAGTKLWARCWDVGQNTGTLDFFLGIHEYEG